VVNDDDDDNNNNNNNKHVKLKIRTLKEQILICVENFYFILILSPVIYSL
jgi:hypothetical protein